MSFNCHSTLVIVSRNPQLQVLHCSGLCYCIYSWAQQSGKLRWCLRPLLWEGKLLGMSCAVFFLAWHRLLQGGVLIAQQTASLAFTGWADFLANWWGNLGTNGAGKKSILSEVCFLPALLSGGRDGRYKLHNGLYQNTRGHTPPVSLTNMGSFHWVAHTTYCFWKMIAAFYPPSEYKASCRNGIPFF